MFHLLYIAAIVLNSFREVDLANSEFLSHTISDENSANVTSSILHLENELTTQSAENSTFKISPNISAANHIPSLGIPRPTVSQEAFDSMMPILTIFNLVFEAVSVILTSISACVHALPNMRCATAYYLVALNLADTVSGILVVIKRIRDVIWGVNTPSSEGFAYLTLVGTLYMSVSCRRVVYLMSVIVSLERLFVVVCPLRARYIKLIRYPKICIISLSILTLTFHAYLLLKYEVAPSSSGLGYTVLVRETFKVNEQTFDGVSNAAKFLFSYIPLALCLVLSAALMVVLRRHTAARMSLQESHAGDLKNSVVDKVERQLATTIWLSILLFTLLSLPSNTTQLVATFHPSFHFYGFEHLLYRLVDNFTQIPLIGSRYTNFLSYVCLSTAFRRNFKRVCNYNKRARGQTAPRHFVASSAGRGSSGNLSADQTHADLSVTDSSRL